MGLERLMGVEPTYAAWEAAVLPMNYSRIFFIIADPISNCKINLANVVNSVVGITMKYNKERKR